MKDWRTVPVLRTCDEPLTIREVSVSLLLMSGSQNFLLLWLIMSPVGQRTFLLSLELLAPALSPGPNYEKLDQDWRCALMLQRFRTSKRHAVGSTVSPKVKKHRRNGLTVGLKACLYLWHRPSLLILLSLGRLPEITGPGSLRNGYGTESATSCPALIKKGHEEAHLFQPLLRELVCGPMVIDDAPIYGWLTLKRTMSSMIERSSKWPRVTN